MPVLNWPGAGNGSSPRSWAARKVKLRGRAVPAPGRLETRSDTALAQADPRQCSPREVCADRAALPRRLGELFLAWRLLGRHGLLLLLRGGILPRFFLGGLLTD